MHVVHSLPTTPIPVARSPNIDNRVRVRKRNTIRIAALTVWTLVYREVRVKSVKHGNKVGRVLTLVRYGDTRDARIHQNRMIDGGLLKSRKSQLPRLENNIPTSALLVKIPLGLVHHKAFHLTHLVLNLETSGKKRVLI